MASETTVCFQTQAPAASEDKQDGPAAIGNGDKREKEAKVPSFRSESRAKQEAQRKGCILAKMRKQGTQENSQDRVPEVGVCSGGVLDDTFTHDEGKDFLENPKMLSLTSASYPAEGLASELSTL